MPNWPQLTAGKAIATHHGRGAIGILCEMLHLAPGDEVLMPSYNCGTEVDPFLKAGVRVILYRVDAEASIDLPDILRRITDRTKAIYVTHYFGWPQDVRGLQEKLAGRNLPLIEDCALALFSRGKEGWLGSLGDAAIFSFVKSLGVPDGGALVCRTIGRDIKPSLSRPPAGAVWRAALPLLKSYAMRKVERYKTPKIEVFPQEGLSDVQQPLETLPDMPQDYYFDPRESSWTISRLSMGLLARTDPASVISIRRGHYFQLLDGLKKVEGAIRPLFRELPEGVCPLCMPLLVENRRRWRQMMRVRRIAAGMWWAGYHRDLHWDDFPEARELKDHLVAIPIHQDLEDRHIAYTIRTIQEIAGLVSAR